MLPLLFIVELDTLSLSAIAAISFDVLALGILLLGAMLSSLPLIPCSLIAGALIGGSAAYMPIRKRVYIQYARLIMLCVLSVTNVLHAMLGLVITAATVPLLLILDLSNHALIEGTVVSLLGLGIITYQDTIKSQLQDYHEVLRCLLRCMYF